MAKTDVPETVVCPNCNHHVVIHLYQVDSTINSSQGHFHTVHHSREPAYTVYCINCGHFITNDPTGKSPRAARSRAVAQETAKPGAARPARPDSGRIASRKKRSK